MTQWHDTMVDRPETDGAVNVTGWTISSQRCLGRSDPTRVSWDISSVGWPRRMGFLARCELGHIARSASGLQGTREQGAFGITQLANKRLGMTHWGKPRLAIL